MNGVPSLAFVGAGSLGQSFAGLLAASGQSATLLASPTTADRLLTAGHIRLRGVVDVDVPVSGAPAPVGTVGITDDPGMLPSPAGLIFATKGHQLGPAVRAVRAVWPAAGDDSSWVAGVQNGLVKDDVLREAFGERRVAGAVTILGAGRQAVGEVTVYSRGMTYLGEFPAGISDRVNEAVEILRKAEIPAEASGDIQSVLWSKECNAVGVFGVSVPVRMSASAMMRIPDLIRAYLSLVRETAAVAAAYGVQVGDYAGFPIKTYVERSDEETLAALLAPRPAQPGAPPGPPIMPSMTQDLLAGRPMEADEVFADVVVRAEKVGVPVPRIEVVRDLICGLNRTLV